MNKWLKKGIIVLGTAGIITGGYLAFGQQAIKEIQLSTGAKITLSANLGGVEKNIDSQLTPAKTETGDKTQFGYFLNNISKETADNLKSITFHVVSDQKLEPMGTYAVGYWLPPKEGMAIEAFKYDFSDIAKKYTIPVQGQVREYIDGKWTGKFIDGIVQQPVPHNIIITESGADITFDLSGIKFVEGQNLDFDPIAQAGSNIEYFPNSTANTGTVSTAINVPADAEFVIVGIAGYRFTPTNPFSSGGMTFTKGGTAIAMTPVGGADSNNSYFYAGMFYLLQPDTGTNKTMTWDWQGTAVMNDAPVFSLTYWKGIDTSSPVRDSDGAQNSNTPYTTPTLTASSGDLIVAWIGGYASSEGTINSWTNLVELTEIARVTSNADGAWATGSPSGNTTVTAATDTNFDDGGILAVVLVPAAAEAGTSQPNQDIIWFNED